MLLIITFLCLAFEAHASDISSHGSTTVMYGGEARFTCALANPTGVLQVTWQRGLKPESLENMATYNKPVGQQVNDPFKGKVSFTESSLTSSSIILRNVTWEDENCYVCSFNAYPDGSIRKQMCLKVEGISVAHKKNSSKTSSAIKGRQEVLSCSATGKPAPTISWNVPTQIIIIEDHQPTTSVKNGDGTFTSSQNVTLNIPADWTGYVDCVVNKGMTGERREEFPFSSLEQMMEENRSQHGMIIAVLIILICVIFILAIVIHKRLKNRGDSFTAV